MLPERYRAHTTGRVLVITNHGSFAAIDITIPLALRYMHTAWDMDTAPACIAGTIVMGSGTVADQEGAGTP